MTWIQRKQASAILKVLRKIVKKLFANYLSNVQFMNSPGLKAGAIHILTTSLNFLDSGSVHLAGRIHWKVTTNLELQYE